MTIEMIIDKAIKELWIEDIPEDYNALRLLKEDSLKNSFYYHLRRRLGDDFLDENNLKIYTEFDVGPLRGTNKRADLAIVKLKDDDSFEGFLGDFVEEIIAIVEFKYKNGQVGSTDSINADFAKIKSYIQQDHIECQYYEAVIQETYWENMAWLDKRATNNWAKGKVTELVASYNKDAEMEFGVFSYNGMNEEL